VKSLRPHLEPKHPQRELLQIDLDQQVDRRHPLVLLGHSSVIVGSQIAKKRALETGHRASAVGRRPVLVEFCPEHAYSLGLTISRTGVEAEVANQAGGLLGGASIDIARVI